MRPRFEKDSDSDDDDDALSLAESLNDDDDALSLAESLNIMRRVPQLPPRPTAKTASCGSSGCSARATQPHSGRAAQGMLLCGAGAAWVLAGGRRRCLHPGGCRGRRRRFGRAGAGGRVRAAGLIALAHEPIGGKDALPTLSVWSAPAVGLQTLRSSAPSPATASSAAARARSASPAARTRPSCGSPSVSGPARPFTRTIGARVKAAERGEENKIGAIEWLPGGPGRRYAASCRTAWASRSSRAAARS